MSNSDSAPSPQWQIKDASQNVSGPYTTTQLLEFASDGLIAKNAEVRHPQQTKGQWVGVMKIAKLSASIETAFTKPADPFAAFTTAVASNVKPVINSESEASTDTPSLSRYRFESASSLSDFFDVTLCRYLTPVLVQLFGCCV